MRIGRKRMIPCFMKMDMRKVVMYDSFSWLWREDLRVCFASAGLRGLIQAP